MWFSDRLTCKELFRRVWRQFWDDRVLDQSAKLSFYFFLSVFPLLLFLVALLGYLLQSGQALHEALQKYLAAITPASASNLIDRTLREVTKGSNGGKLSLGLVFALWAASKGMLAIMDALNIAYSVGEARRWWKRRLVGLGLTIGFVLLMFAALGLVMCGDRLVQMLAHHFGSQHVVQTAWDIVRWVLLLACVVFAFNVLYVYAPNVRHHQWHWLMPGTLVGVGLWLLTSYGFKIYLQFFNRYSVTYGSIGAVIILLLWFYLSGIAILIGGEVNSEIEKASGKIEQKLPTP